jgi:photosystem II stability/assembly factor-like uncharacterized protein
MRFRIVVLLTIGACLDTTAAMRAQPRTRPEPLAWQLSAGPFTGNVKALVESQSGILFALANAVVYRSTDDGAAWIRCESQPTHHSGVVNFEPWLLSVGRRLYSSGDPGGSIYVSDDDCASARALEPPPRVDGGPLRSVTVVNGVLLAAQGASLFALHEDGRTWIQNDLPAGTTDPRLASRGGSLFLVRSGQLYRSMNRGVTWTALAAGLQFSYVVPEGTSLYAAAVGGIWRSVDDGETWTRLLETALTALTVRGSTLYAFVFNPGAIARSADAGTSWTTLPAPLPRHSANALLETRRGTVVAATGNGIFRSTDAGSTWTPTGVRGIRVRSLVAGRGRAYLSVEDGSLFHSGDGGLSWSRVDAVAAGSPRPQTWTTWFELMSLGDGARLYGASQRALFVSNDRGVTWAPSGLNKEVNGLVRLGSSWFASTNDGVFRSDDLTQWQECSSGLQSHGVRALAATAEGDLIAFNGFSTSRSTDTCTSWSPFAGGPPVRGPDGYRTRPVLSSDATLGVILLGDGIAQLSIPDRKWIVRAEAPIITAFVQDDQGHYWLGTRDGVSRLTVEGTDWRIDPMGLEGSISALAFEPGGYLLAAVDDRGVFRARLPL